MDDVRSDETDGVGAADAERAMPRWVKGFVIAGILVAVLVVVILLAGDDHGPGRHELGSGASAVPAPLG